MTLSHRRNNVSRFGTLQHIYKHYIEHTGDFLRDQSNIFRKSMQDIYHNSDLQQRRIQYNSLLPLVLSIMTLTIWYSIFFLISPAKYIFAHLMHINILFVTLTFVIVIAVILLADNLTTAMLIVSLLANFLVISSQFGKISKNTLGLNIREWGVPLSEQKKEIEEKSVFQHEDPIIYGPSYEMWHAYQDGYTKCYDEPQAVVGVSCAEKNSGIDAANALMAQRRFRDKKCSDGWASKDANYYKHHFAGELDEVEDKPWWSRHEY